ncbi:MAG: hypothetical protein JXR31_07555 [Prolixibacteraceae bacterium]|nr:hypothetical protein [Prolixibacteraceae bacterium]MBN2774087.1 hypothetical protein [Prolixibacteraceae bacterium]
MTRKILFSILILLVFTNCEKDDSELYEEVLKVEAKSVNETGNQRFFILIENSTSTPVFREFQNYTDYTFIRNGKIKGDKVNIHTISLNTFGDTPSYVIRSYFSVPIGRVAVFGRDNILNEKSAASRVKLEFENIPDFDIVTRSAHLQTHCHTQKTFLDVPCEPVGYNTFPANETFYSCFQKGTEASYLLSKIRTNESTFTIVFDSLNTQMSHYHLPKMMGNSKMSQISVMAYDSQINAIQLFNLNDVSIFQEDNIDFFVPVSEMNINHFLIEYSTFIGNTLYSHVFSSENIVTTPELIDAELSAASVINRDIDISATGEFDFMSVRINFEGSSWTFYGAGDEDLYYPDFPIELTEAAGYPDFPENSETINISLFDYSELSGYNDALEILMDDSRALMDSTGLSYRSLNRIITYNH